jgi:hypothetical protein
LARVLKKQEQTTVENLIKISIDVYNDSKLLAHQHGHGMQEHLPQHMLISLIRL